MFIFFGIMVWLILGFCAYIWMVRSTYTTYFDWGEFLINVCLGLISFIAAIVNSCVYNFKNIMELLVKKINK